MDARPLALAAGVALAAWLFISLQRDLVRADAGMQARVFAGLTYLLMASSWAAVLLSIAPLWIAWIATAGAFVVTVAPRALLRVPTLPRVALRVPGLRFARADSHRQRLAAEVGSIRMGLSTLTTSSHERELLRTRVRRLERWRASPDPIARELVTLVEEAVNERLDVGPAAFDRARERRIRELLTRLRG